MSQRGEKLWALIEDNYLGLDAPALEESFARHLEYSQAKTRFTATPHDAFKSACYAVRDRIMEQWNDTQRAYYEVNAKRVYYLSLEFLLGRALGNALINLGIRGEMRQALEELGQSLESLEEQEPDAGHRNGGLGRLAACYLDSLATLQLPGYGYGIRYDYGIFEQQIRDGQQVEHPDPWLRFGHPWEIVRPEYQYRVRFGGHVHQRRDETGKLRHELHGTTDVFALAYDVPIPGYRNGTVNTLRLWRARAFQEFDLADFNGGDYLAGVEEKNLS